MPTLASLNVALTASASQFDFAFGAARKQVDSLRSSVSSAISPIRDFALNIKTMTAAALGLGSATAAIGFGVKLAANAEQAEIAFTTMLKSGEKAKTLLGEMKTFGAQTPFEFPEIQDAGKKLLAFGVSGDQVVGTLRRIGDISSGVGVPLADLAEIYGKARVQGRLMAEDVNQLTGRGIPVIQEFAKQFGVTEGEVRKLVESGKIGFANFEQAFISLTSSGGLFFGMTKKSSEGLSGLFSTLKDNVGFTLEEISKQLIKAFDLKGVISSAISYLDQYKTAIADSVVNATISAVSAVKQAISFFEQWGQTIANATALIGSYIVTVKLIAAATMAWQAATLAIAASIRALAVISYVIGVIRAFVQVLMTVKTAQQAIAAGQALMLSLAGPKGWAQLAAGAAVAAAALYGVQVAFDGINDAGKELAAIKVPEIPAGIDEKGNVANPGNAIPQAVDFQANAAASEAKKAQEELTKSVKETIEQYKFEAQLGHLSAREQAIAKLEQKGATAEAIDELIKYNRQIELNESAEKAMKDAAQKKDSRDKAIQSITDSLQEQISTFGAGKDAVELYRAAMAGATSEELDRIREMQEEVARLADLDKQRDIAADNALQAVQQAPGAALAGSKEAFTAIREFNSTQNADDRIPNKQLEEAKKANELLADLKDEIKSNQAQLVIAEI